MHYHSVLLMLLFIILLGKYFLFSLFRIIIYLNRFRTDTRELPVLWHQSLLSFVQNYRQDISTGKRENFIFQIILFYLNRTKTSFIRITASSISSYSWS
jgi:hypothetical protein